MNDKHDEPLPEERTLGALWGAVVGDALGVPVEFQGRQALQQNPVTGMRGFGTHRQPAGTWSDDSSLLLCTADSLCACGGYDALDLGQRFVRWEKEAYWTPHGDVFDVGVTTSQAISRIAQGVAPEAAGGVDVYSNGNGSLMRILPMGLWFRESSIEKLASYAQRGSSLTHRHPRSQMACTLYCLILRALMEGTLPQNAVTAAIQDFGRIYEEPPYLAERLNFQRIESGRLQDLPEDEINSSGYVIHTLTASVWCLLTSTSFEETVLKAVNLGGDTDTTGCVAGGLAGAWYGERAIPHEWKASLARKDDLAALFTEFGARISNTAPKRSS